MTYAEFEREPPRSGRFRVTGCSTYALAARCEPDVSNPPASRAIRQTSQGARDIFVPVFDRDRETPRAQSAICLVTRNAGLTSLIEEIRADGFSQHSYSAIGGDPNGPAELARLRAWTASNADRLVTTRTLIGEVTPIRDLKSDTIRKLEGIRPHLRSNAVALVEDSSPSGVAASTLTLERERYALGTFLALLLACECVLRARPGSMRPSPVRRPPAQAPDGSGADVVASAQPD